MSNSIIAKRSLRPPRRSYSKPAPQWTLDDDHPLSKGLICCLPLGFPGNDIDIDLSNAQFNFTTHNISSGFASHHGGMSYSFDGTTSFLLPALENGNRWYILTTTPWSIFAWINTSSSANMQIVSDWDVTDPGWMFALNEFSVGHHYLLFASVSGTNYFGKTTAAAGDVVNDGKWHHVGAAYDGSGTAAGIRLYVDGRLATGTTNLSAGTGIPGTLLDNSPLIGKRNYNPAPEYYSGFMDMVRIYKRMTTDTEATQLYAEPYAGIYNAQIASAAQRVGKSSFNAGWANQATRVISGGLVG